MNPMSFEFDHFLVFVPPIGKTIAATLTDQGFVATPERSHPGQGTSNHCLLLQKHYIEFIWIDSLSDAQTNPMQLHRRADYLSHGSCPFGFGMRGTVEQETDYWKYHPPYAPERFYWIHRNNESEPASPLLFVQPADTPQARKAFWPSERITENHLAHPNGVRAIREIRLSGPYAANEFPQMDAFIVVEKAKEHSCTLILEGSFAPMQLTNYCSILPHS